MAKAKSKKKEITEIGLTKEELQKVNTYKVYIDQVYAQLGSIRKQFLLQEKKTLEMVEKAEKEFMSYINETAGKKKIPSDEKWGFDQSANKFVKQT